VAERAPLLLVQVQKLEALQSKQAAVLRRKTEEAEAARRRLKVRAEDLIVALLRSDSVPSAILLFCCASQLHGRQKDCSISCKHCLMCRRVGGAACMMGPLSNGDELLKISGR